VPIAELDKLKGGKGLVALGGVIMDVRQIYTKKKNEPMAFVRLEDTTGTAEVVVFPQPFKQNHAALIKDNAVMVEGKIEERDGEIKVLAEKLTVLHHENIAQVRDMLAHYRPAASAVAAEQGAAPATLSTERQDICVAVPPTMPPSLANELKRIFAAHPGSRRVYLLVKDKTAPKKIETSFYIAFSGDAISEIEALVGRGAVQG
jgi:DNA polymerase-3 subunit alpha